MKPLVGLFAGTMLFAIAPADYFALQSGNQWIYAVSETGTRMLDPVVVTVSQASNFNGNTYLLYSGFDSPEWLRADAQGALYLYDPATKLETMFMTTGGIVTAPGGCNQTGRVVSTDATYTGPIGTWRGGVIEIQYDTGTCADAGIIDELYLADVGLVQRTVQTVAGPRTYDLVYARIGGALVTSGPETGFTLALDNVSYPAGGTARARIALRHVGGDLLSVDFPTGQEYDLVIRDSHGNQVYQWSTGRLFTQMFHTITVDGEKDWTLLIPFDQLPPGSYVAEASLASTNSGAWVASVPFTLIQ